VDVIVREERIPQRREKGDDGEQEQDDVEACAALRSSNDDRASLV